MATYREMLKNIADYGHGVFTLTMAGERKQQNSLTVWLRRNPDVYRHWKGVHPDVGVYCLTREGMAYFDGKDTLSTSKSYFSYLEMAILNSYMVEKNHFVSYKLKPHLVVEIAGKTIGVLSPRYGIPKHSSAINLLISTPETRREFLEEVATQPDRVRSIIQSCYVPTPLKFLGNMSRNS